MIDDGKIEVVEASVTINVEGGNTFGELTANQIVERLAEIPCIKEVSIRLSQPHETHN